jgi:hypothetical protein
VPTGGAASVKLDHYPMAVTVMEAGLADHVWAEETVVLIW